LLHLVATLARTQLLQPGGRALHAVAQHSQVLLLLWRRRRHCLPCLQPLLRLLHDAAQLRHLIVAV
jgi:hypothetical protein